eukprot:scaffold4273_cov389-Prasinococcus_capsulatus_cf.AAC.4
MVDYSKWDRLELDSEDEREEQRQQRRRDATVTHLDGPSQVTFGGRTHEEQHTIRGGGGHQRAGAAAGARQGDPRATAAAARGIGGRRAG